MSIMCDKIIFHHTPKFFLWLENIVISNYNKCSKLTFKKIEEPLSMRVRLVNIYIVFYKVRNIFYGAVN